MDQQEEKGGVMMRVYLHRAAVVRGTIGVSLLAMACAQPAFAQSEEAVDPSDIVVIGTATVIEKGSESGRGSGSAIEGRIEDGNAIGI